MKKNSSSLKKEGTPHYYQKLSLWKEESYLFPPLPHAVREVLEDFPRIIDEVWPLQKVHRRNLPRDIVCLSRMLTSSRKEMTQPYWSKPAFISAYLYYFLPWNIIRLARLLSSLNFPEPERIGNYSPILYDLGSGPLTLPITLWLTHPHFHDLPLECVCIDKSPQPMETGAKIFRTIASRFNKKAWPIHLLRNSLAEPLHPTKKLERGYPWLIAAINLLNEISTAKSRQRSVGREEDTEEKCLTKFLEFLKSVCSVHELKDNHPLHFLFVEPGTRLGGSLIMKLREMAIALGLKPVSPCTHNKPCPLLCSASSMNSSFAKSWCHFTFLVENVPAWLLDLSEKAGLEKHSLSLSLLLLNQSEEFNKEKNEMHTRVLSNHFAALNDQFCRYGCASCGRVLLKDAKYLSSGSEVIGYINGIENHDPKSGAVILTPQKSKTSFKIKK